MFLLHMSLIKASFLTYFIDYNIPLPQTIDFFSQNLQCLILSISELEEA